VSLVFATGNQGKLRELAAMSGNGVEVLGKAEVRETRGVELEDVVEDADTFIGNALLKAASARRLTGLDAVADDSGLAVAALDGAPGVYSARFAGEQGDPQANMDLLLERMTDVADERRGAAFHCALVLAGPLAEGPGCGRTEDGIAWRAFVGRTDGTITRARVGSGGFGYDPIFLSTPLGQTFGEADAQAKHRVSHRGAAFRQLTAYLDAARVQQAASGRPLFIRRVGLNALARAFDGVLQSGLRYADKAMEASLREHPELGGKERAAVAHLYWHGLRRLDRLSLAVAAVRTRKSAPSPDPRALSGRDAGVLAALVAADVDPGGAPLVHRGGAGESALQALLKRDKHFENAMPAPPAVLARGLSKASGAAEASRTQDGTRGGYHPDFERACREQLGDEHALMALDYLDTRGPLTLRVNPRRATIEEVQAELMSAGIRTVPTGPTALTCTGSARVTTTDGFRGGHFEIQDAGSQDIAHALAARPGDTIIDWCAGAGGKTLAIAATMKGKGRLVAADIHGGRLSECRRRLRRAGERSVEVLGHRDGEVRDDRLPLADAVLVDAPCSSSGALRRSPELRWRLDADWLGRFPAQQLAILQRAARHVRPSGRLVYATCSIMGAENEGVRAAFLDANPGWALASEHRVGPADPAWLRTKPLAAIGPDGFYFAVLTAPGGDA